MFVASRKYKGEILDPNSDAQTFQEAPDTESILEKPLSASKWGWISLLEGRPKHTCLLIQKHPYSSLVVVVCPARGYLA